MSAKAGDDEVEEYAEEDDNDEEDDFHPDGEDYDDDDDDDDDEEYDDDEDDDNENEGDVSYLDGVLSYDKEGQKLHYKGHGFHLESTDPVPLTSNILDRACKPLLPSDNTLSIAMVGPCDVITTEESLGRKPTPRKVQMTFTVADANGELKSDYNDDDEEGAKKPSVFYQVYGTEINNPEYGIEFKGGFAPTISGDGTNEIRLLCQVRMSNVRMSKAVTATSTTSAAVAVGKRGRSEHDDNIDDVDEDGIDHNELIALHEEAKLSTEALKKRYRGQSVDRINGDDKDVDGEQLENKVRAGSKTKYNNSHADDDDDDDDIEF